MAPPRKGGAAAEQAKERLTAVVMADSFTQASIFCLHVFNSTLENLIWDVLDSM
jgi:hypothetical protein